MIQGAADGGVGIIADVEGKRGKWIAGGIDKRVFEGDGVGGCGGFVGGRDLDTRDGESAIDAEGKGRRFGAGKGWGEQIARGARNEAIGELRRLIDCDLCLREDQGERLASRLGVGDDGRACGAAEEGGEDEGERGGDDGDGGGDGEKFAAIAAGARAGVGDDAVDIRAGFGVSGISQLKTKRLNGFGFLRENDGAAGVVEAGGRFLGKFILQQRGGGAEIGDKPARGFVGGEEGFNFGTFGGIELTKSVGSEERVVGINGHGVLVETSKGRQSLCLMEGRIL